MSLLHFSFWVPYFIVSEGSPEEQRVCSNGSAPPSQSILEGLVLAEERKGLPGTHPFCRPWMWWRTSIAAEGTRGTIKGCVFGLEKVWDIHTNSASPHSGKAKTLGVLRQKLVQLILVVPSRFTAIIQWGTEASLKTYSTACPWLKAVDPGDIIYRGALPHTREHAHHSPSKSGSQIFSWLGGKPLAILLGRLLLPDFKCKIINPGATGNHLNSFCPIKNTRTSVKWGLGS